MALTLRGRRLVRRVAIDIVPPGHRTEWVGRTGQRRGKKRACSGWQDQSEEPFEELEELEEVESLFFFGVELSLEDELEDELDESLDDELDDSVPFEESLDDEFEPEPELDDELEDDELGRESLR